MRMTSTLEMDSPGVACMPRQILRTSPATSAPRTTSPLPASARPRASSAAPPARRVAPRAVGRSPPSAKAAKQRPGRRRTCPAGWRWQGAPTWRKRRRPGATPGPPPPSPGRWCGCPGPTRTNQTGAPAHARGSGGGRRRAPPPTRHALRARHATVPRPRPLGIARRGLLRRECAVRGHPTAAAWRLAAAAALCEGGPGAWPAPRLTWICRARSGSACCTACCTSCSTTWRSAMSVGLGSLSSTCARMRQGWQPTRGMHVPGRGVRQEPPPMASGARRPAAALGRETQRPSPAARGPAEQQLAHRGDDVGGEASVDGPAGARVLGGPR